MSTSRSTPSLSAGAERRQPAWASAQTFEAPELEALVDALYYVLSSAARRAGFRCLSLERAKAFRWEETARRTLNVLREVGSE